MQNVSQFSWVFNLISKYPCHLIPFAVAVKPILYWIWWELHAWNSFGVKPGVLEHSSLADLCKFRFIRRPCQQVRTFAGLLWFSGADLCPLHQTMGPLQLCEAECFAADLVGLAKLTAALKHHFGVWLIVHWKLSGPEIWGMQQTFLVFFFF